MSRAEHRIANLPSMPRWRATKALRRLSKRDLAERCWAADVNHEGAAQSASEAWARVAELVEMLEGRKPIDEALIARLKEHHAHVVGCRMGSCWDDFHALIRAGLETAPALAPGEVWPDEPRRGIETFTLPPEPAP